MFTCCNHVSCYKNLHEEDFAGSEEKILGGVVKGAAVRCYRRRLKQFTIGNIDMGEQDIWIIFDGRVTDAVLGMDVLDL